MAHGKRQRQARTFPPVPPLDRIHDEQHVLENFVRRHNDREAQREHNGTPSAYRNPQRASERDERADAFAALIAADTRPVTERVSEYALRFDGNGRVVGISGDPVDAETVLDVDCA